MGFSPLEVIVVSALCLVLAFIVQYIMAKMMAMEDRLRSLENRNFSPKSGKRTHVSSLSESEKLPWPDEEEDQKEDYEANEEEDQGEDQEEDQQEDQKANEEEDQEKNLQGLGEGIQEGAGGELKRGHCELDDDEEGPPPLL